MMRITGEEALHILASVVTISLAFSFLNQNISLEGNVPVFDFNNFFTILVTVGLGFILHELAHKYVAIRHGAYAEYRAWTLGLLLTVVSAVALGFVFAAPGAVYIFGHISRETNGKISLAGPATNLALALAFLALAFSVPSLAGLGLTGAMVNTFLGIFNMLPFGPLDGKKVLDWNAGVWAGTLAVLVVLFVTIGRL